MAARRHKRTQYRLRTRARVAMFGALLLSAAGAACSSSSSSDATATTTTVAVTSSTSTTVPTIVGDPVNQYTLGLGDCFNRYEVGTDTIVTKVSCNDAHQREVFALLVHPAPFGDPWPGDEALQRYGIRLCYQGFESFVGKIYELSELGIGVFTPPQPNWEDSKARYRTITCYLSRNDGKTMIGTMHQKGV